MKSLKKYLGSLRIDDCARATIASYIIYGDTGVHSITENEYRSRKYSGYQIPDDYQINKDVVVLMAEVNAMVKDKNCPRNLKNRFYKRKEFVIEELIREGRCSDFYKEGYCYSLLVDEKYKFHQLKDSHPNWEKGKYSFDGEREFVPGESLPFDLERYKEFMISATYYLGARREEYRKMLPVE